MPKDRLAGTAELGTLPTGTQTLTLTATVSCDVEKASPFDRLHAKENVRKKAQRARRPSGGQNRQSAPHGVIQ
jgi:hypothetical protein